MTSILSSLLSLVSIISPCIVFGTCCYFLTKKPVVEAILMAIGSGVGLLVTLFYSVLMPFLLTGKHLEYTDISQYYTLIGIVSFMAGVSFAAGFLILIINTLKKQAANNDQFPKSID